MNILKQSNGYECGPIAVNNAMVLLGMEPPRLKQLHRMLLTDRDGTTGYDMRNALRDLHILERSYTYNPKADKVMSLAQIITGDKVLVLGYEVGDEGHYVTVSYENNSFYAYNWGTDLVVSKVSFKKLKKRSKVAFDWVAEKVLDEASEIYLIKKG